MSGLPWFELDVDFHDHPKTFALEVALKNPLAEAYVSRVWAYCYRHATDRFSGPAAVATIERAARWRGKTGALVTALLATGFLDQEGQTIVAHGVADRLAPHLDHREKAAERQRRRRDSLRTSQPAARDVTRDVQRESRPDIDKDKDRDSTESLTVTDPQPVPRPPPPTAREAGGGGLESLRGKLASELGVRAVSIGRDRDRTVASFDRWLRVAGEDATVLECVSIARDKQVTPASLSWWVGWLDTVSDQKLASLFGEASRAAGVGA